jgi:proline dehydrogenase
MWPGRFIAGNSIQHVLPVAKRVLDNTKWPIINYAIEHTSLPEGVFHEHMQLIKHLDYHYKIAIKVSSFGFDEDLIDALVEKCVGKNIRVIIDAEDNIHHDQYQDISNYIMQKHNKYIPYVVKTYQMYRKDGLETLERDLIDSRINNYHLGIKMVRGAYYHAEKKDGHLFTEKHLTDESYNKGILTIGQNNVNTYTILATHNFDSVRLGYMYNRYAKRRVFEFAHLMGMQEENYQGLVDLGQKINVYIPYGPYRQMLPYLTRRLYENIDMIRYMK